MSINQVTVRLHHVALATDAYEDARRFYRDIWGLAYEREQAACALLGAAPDSYCLMLVRRPERSVEHFCLSVEDPSALAEMRGRFEAGGVRFLELPEDRCPGLKDAFRVVDVDGRILEMGIPEPLDAVEASSSAETSTIDRPLKLGHLVLNTPDIDRSTGWYEEYVLTVRDWREHQMSFLFGNEDHHTIAFNRSEWCSLNHLAYELTGINAFMRGVGRVERSGLAERLWGPGRHGPGDYIFCYFRDPTGFVCEYETDGLKIDDPATYDFRVWKYAPENSDQWLEVSGPLPDKYRDAARGTPDPGLVGKA